jgi:ATP-dependent Lhr-like helicase
MVRRRTLARLRKEVEPVEQQVFARLVAKWQGVMKPRRGLDALLDAIETLQGAAIPISDLEREVLPARVNGYSPSDLDTLVAAGEVVWVGVEQIGERDGRVALYLTQNLSVLLSPSTADTSALSERAQRILEVLGREGALFFPALHSAAGGGFSNDTIDAVWELVWGGWLTNDTMHPLRGFLRAVDDKRSRPTAADGRPGSPEFLRRFRSRTAGGGTPAQGRWSLVSSRRTVAANPTEWSAAIAQQLLVRYGIVMRETAAAENIPGGYSTLYPALRTMEESGWIRRGMFIAAMGAAQFAMTSAVDMLRSLRGVPDQPEAVHLAASDPANVYGALLPWPRTKSDQETTSPHGMARASGASVVIINGTLAAFLRRRNPSLRVLLPEDEPDRTQYAKALARVLAEVAVKRQSRKSGLFIGEINGAPAREHFLSRFLEESGFVDTSMGFQMRRTNVIEKHKDLAAEDEDDSDVVETA